MKVKVKVGVRVRVKVKVKVEVKVKMRMKVRCYNKFNRWMSRGYIKPMKKTNIFCLFASTGRLATALTTSSVDTIARRELQCYTCDGFAEEMWVGL